MVIIICILSILLLLSIGLNMLLFKAIKILVNNIKEIDDIEEEIAFFEGKININEDRILNKFTDVFLLLHVEFAENPIILKSFDISQYEKNHIIGLTEFAQPQVFQEVKNKINVDKIKNTLRADFMKIHNINPEEADMEFIDSVLNETINEVLAEEDFKEFTQLLPHCTVYQLKDGRWLWRQKFS